MKTILLLSDKVLLGAIISAVLKTLIVGILSICLFTAYKYPLSVENMRIFLSVLGVLYFAQIISKCAKYVFNLYKFGTNE